ncbi:hypothetical protein [Falsirhodobacter sp. alg1]|uniref:hypothetical protein n=1 Tax=Falsirhodobacter sp. alg1 TaxID=1472418 RepID=UPI0005F0A2C8|nr:hypothetical protein [Falsirhodobacter sp. alg1]
MRDPMAEPQVDDVLSSIRRLTTSAPVSDTAPLGKLLLTPALRVDPDQSAASQLPVSGDVHDRMAPIDEEVLHDLIRDLLTEELQGPFGEKITHNIRKMVRAEISRALAQHTQK